MMTKGLSRKQIIIPMNLNNTNKFITHSSSHIMNINRALKNIKSDVIADFICIENKDLIITTRKP